MRRPLSSLVALCSLLALALIFFLPLLRGATFSTVAGRHVSVYPWRALDPVFPDYPQNDQADLSYPWQTFLTRSLRSGEFPLWNPYSFGGQPFFANGSSAVLYPPKLIAAALFNPGWAHDVLSIFHLLVAGIGMWLFLRELRFSAAPALLGGIAWMFCPFNMAWLHLEVVAPAAAWLPVACFLTHRAIDGDSWPSTIGALVALALALVSGHLLFMALVYGIVVLYGTALTFARLYHDRTRGRDAALVRLAAVIVGPLMLAAVVLVPTVIFLRSLGREPLPYQLAHAAFRVPYGAFAHLVVPPPAAPVTEREMHEMAYVGRLVAVLAAIGFSSRLRGAWFGRILAVGTFLVATDTIVLRWIYAVVPRFSFFSPLGRLLNLFDFGVIILGVAGFETLLRWLPGRNDRRTQATDGSSPDPRDWPRPLSAGLIATIVILGVTALELVVYARRVNPEFPPREQRFSFPRTPFIRSLGPELGAGHNGPGRLIPIRRSVQDAFAPPILSANESMVFGFESVAGWDSTLPNRAETLWRIVGGEPIEAVLAATYRRAFWASFDVAGTRFDVLPRVGVTTIVAAPEVADDPLWPQRRDASTLTLRSIYSGVDGRIYRIVGADGGPIVVARPTFVNTSREALDWVLNPQFDYRDQAVLETDDVPLKWRAHGTSLGKGSARVVSKAVNIENIEVNSANAAWVVVPTNWDAGWSAEVDGQPVPVVRANYTFQAVPIPAGGRQLRLTYQPRGLGAGLVISLSTAVLALLFLASSAGATSDDIPAPA
jgi:hypothetical protein